MKPETTTRRRGRLPTIILGLAVILGSFAVTEAPASAGIPTGCRTVTRSVDDHTLIGARAYRFTSVWRWCWHHSIVTAFSRSWNVDHLDYLYHWDGSRTSFGWLRYANVPYLPSNRGGWSSHVKVNIHNCLWIVCGDFNPWMNARGYAGGHFAWATGGYSWSR